MEFNNSWNSSCPSQLSTGLVPSDALVHATDLASFITASPSSYHAVAEIIRRTKAAGYHVISELDKWNIVCGERYVVARDGAVICFVVPPTAGPNTPFTIIGTHTDSPGFKLKPSPTFGSAGFWQAAVEVYGSPLLNSWLDRELELAGRIVTKDGTTHLIRSGPLLRIPQLAIHLDRSANDNLVLDRQRHMQPVWGLGELEDADILAYLAGTHHFPSTLRREDIVGYDMFTADTQPPETFGAGNALFAAGRLDNLLGTHAALTAILNFDTEGVNTISVFAAFDNEEIGSNTRSGAAGTFLQDVLRRIVLALGGQAENRTRSLAGSWHISCDVGHGIHPNYTEFHNSDQQPLVGRGPILKINANQHYATDAISAALWNTACHEAGVPHQEFVSNNEVPCGSTTGPITATRLGIRTVDVGAPILSMHSARELASTVDPWYLSKALAQALRLEVPGSVG
ncbi:MAG: M18 family aminopeptidase [Promicromonosporaceae bacterium]|nr:M18 family aminopeptidase [Promicromonosporaceae bacterium]